MTLRQEHCLAIFHHNPRFQPPCEKLAEN